MFVFYQKSPIDYGFKANYNESMKRLIFIPILIFIICFCGCYTQISDNNSILDNNEIINDNDIIFDDNDDINDSNNGTLDSDNESVTPPLITPPPDEEEEEKQKKYYAVSTANGLRIRSAPNGNSAVVGTMDKNDAVLFVAKQGDYFKTVYKEKTAYVHANYCYLMEIPIEDEKVESAIDLGSALLGYPYVWGSQRYHWGNGKLNTNFENGKFDCSALVQYVYYKSNKVILDVTSRAQSLNGEYVKKSELKRGDLMFFTNASRYNKTGIERIGHVGIYFGNNYILHTASDYAVIEPISTLRWSYYITARRVV